MSIGAAQRELSRSKGERFLAPGNARVTCMERICHFRDTVLPNVAHVWHYGDDGLWRLGKINASTTEDGVYLVRYP